MLSIMPWDFALVLFVLGVLVPWRGAVRIRELLAHPQITSLERLSVYASTIAFQWVATAFVLWLCHQHAIGAARLAIAVPNVSRAAGAGVALSALLLANQLASLRRLARLSPERQGLLGKLARKLMPQNLVESLAFFALVCTVAVCEEVLYRGFVFVALEDVAGGSVPFAVLGSSLFFAAAHLYQGPRGLLATFLIGALFALVRWWTGSLAPCIVAHLVVDLAAGLLAPRYLRGKTQQLPAANPSIPLVDAPREES